MNFGISSEASTCILTLAVIPRSFAASPSLRPQIMMSARRNWNRETFGNLHMTFEPGRRTARCRWTVRVEAELRSSTAGPPSPLVEHGRMIMRRSGRYGPRIAGSACLFIGAARTGDEVLILFSIQKCGG